MFHDLASMLLEERSLPTKRLPNLLKPKTLASKITGQTAAILRSVWPNQGILKVQLTSQYRFTIAEPNDRASGILEQLQPERPAENCVDIVSECTHAEIIYS